jgi:hypothetical protein
MAVVLVYFMVAYQGQRAGPAAKLTNR